MKINSLAVFCGSKKGNNPVYLHHATVLGKLMGENNITLIYGGGSVGIMGAVANAVMSHGGKVIGIIPRKLLEWEHQHEGITELMVVEDMHTRKKRMYDLCDVAIILPGGFGTLDELFEMVTWNQLSIHDKRIYILNSDGFYNHLLLHLKQMENQGFLYETVMERIVVLNSPEEIIPHII
jgi:uncharacterized protein (TIGR00730 family)